jgi:hypothetical protein
MGQGGKKMELNSIILRDEYQRTILHVAKVANVEWLAVVALISTLEKRRRRKNYSKTYDTRFTMRDSTAEQVNCLLYEGLISCNCNNDNYELTEKAIEILQSLEQEQKEFFSEPCVVTYVAFVRPGGRTRYLRMIRHKKDSSGMNIVYT